MLTIGITVVLVFSVIFLLATLTKLKTYDIMFVALAIIFGGILIATGPIYGYHEKDLVQEVELVQLSEGVYVTRYANDAYLYRYKVENALDKEDSYEADIVRDDVIETEVENCTKPVLRKYVRKAKTGLFSFCWQEKVEHEFYVPKDTIEGTNIVIN